MEKMTDKMAYEMITKIATDVDLVDWANHKIELLDNRYAKAKARKAEKVASDPLKPAIFDILSGAAEPMIIADILVQLDPAFEATSAKVAARLTKLVDEGVVTKEPVKVDKRRVNSYAVVR